MDRHSTFIVLMQFILEYIYKEIGKTIFLNCLLIRFLIYSFIFRDYLPTRKLLDRFFNLEKCLHFFVKPTDNVCEYSIV